MSIVWASFNDFANQSYKEERGDGSCTERAGVGSSSWYKTLPSFSTIVLIGQYPSNLPI